MSRIENIVIVRNKGLRPEQSWLTKTWFCEVGEPYDFVSYSIHETAPYFYGHFGVKAGTSEEEITKIAEEIVNKIPEEHIKDYQNFLRYGEETHWE